MNTYRNRIGSFLLGFIFCVFGYLGLIRWLDYSTKTKYQDIELALDYAFSGSDGCQNSSNGLCCNYVSVCAHPLGGAFEESIWVSGECFCP
jgi:hypothetical protein